MLNKYRNSHIVRNIIGVLVILLLCILGGCQSINIFPFNLSSNYLDVLVKLDVISKDDIAKDEFITNYEVLNVINKIVTVNFDFGSDIISLFGGDSLEPLDCFDDDIKVLMLGLRLLRIMSFEDMYAVKLDNNATYFEALTFVTRMLDDFNECIAYDDDFSLTKKPEVYQAAYKKGLISYKSAKNADLSIPRKEFYRIIYKAINVTRVYYGYGLSKSKYIDDLKDRINHPQESAE